MVENGEKFVGPPAFLKALEDAIRVGEEFLRNRKEMRTAFPNPQIWEDAAQLVKEMKAKRRAIERNVTREIKAILAKG